MPKSLKIFFCLSILGVTLSGCVLPPAIAVATLVLDVGSFAVSGKTATDHGISLLAQEDCALIKILEGKICEAYPEVQGVAVATLQPLPEGDPNLAALEGNGTKDGGRLSDLEYISAQTAELADRFPQGPGNSTAFQAVSASSSQGFFEPAARPQFAEATDTAEDLLGAAEYLSDSARPSDFE